MFFFVEWARARAAAPALPCLWLFSYARPETLPTSCYVVAMLVAFAVAHKPETGRTH